jgi:PAS domain S-box-containing protein
MERNLLKEVTGDIALALKALELEEEAKRAEEAHRTLVQNSLQGLAIIQDGRVVFASPALAEISGYTVEELLALSPEEVEAVVHPEDRERVLKTMRERLAGKEVPARQEFRFLRKDGSVRWLETLATRVEYRGRPALQVAYMDITERKKGRLSSSNASPCSIGQVRRSSKRYRIPSGRTRRCIGLWLNSCPRRPSSWPSKSPRRKRRRFTFSIKAAATLPEKFPKAKN